MLRNQLSILSGLYVGSMFGSFVGMQVKLSDLHGAFFVDGRYMLALIGAIIGSIVLGHKFAQEEIPTPHLIIGTIICIIAVAKLLISDDITTGLITFGIIFVLSLPLILAVIINIAKGG